MEIRRHRHASELLSLAGTYLERNESENNLPIGLAYRLTKNPHYYGTKSPLLLSIIDRQNVSGVAIMTPPKRLILSRVHTDVRATVAQLVAHLRHTQTRVPGVTAPAVEAETFSTGWVASMRGGVSARKTTQLRIFEARAVTDIPLASGRLRSAEMADRFLMAKWLADFSAELGEPLDLQAARNHAERAIDAAELYVWENDVPVCIAAEVRPTKNGTTISNVYTPPEHRNKGYATACVWTLTKQMLADRYTFCNLYTDLSNPTSNSIYLKIGYVPVGDALSFDFLPTASRF